MNGVNCVSHPVLPRVVGTLTHRQIFAGCYERTGEKVVNSVW